MIIMPGSDYLQCRAVILCGAVCCICIFVYRVCSVIPIYYIEIKFLLKYKPQLQQLKLWE